MLKNFQWVFPYSCVLNDLICLNSNKALAQLWIVPLVASFPPLSFNPPPSTLAPCEDAQGPEMPLLPWPWTHNQALCFGFLCWEMGRVQIPYLMGLLWEWNEIECIKNLEQYQCKVNTQLISSHGYSFLKDGDFSKIPRHSMQATKYSYVWEENWVKACAVLHIFLRPWATVHSEVVECVKCKSLGPDCPGSNPMSSTCK